MMKIEILKQGKFTTSGSSVLKMMQNNNTPTLDLIVRESIQNSLDAALPNTKNVGVRFLCDEFEVDDLAKHFPDVEEEIKKISNSSKSKFLSIEDFNTIGLVGNLDGDFAPGEKNQNLGKLVFHIMKAQDQEGAGGSWGIGKTVYYRIGEGLVCYYSRIKLDNGKFQERLVASLVENETKKDGILSKYDKNLGVAFFGEDLENDGNIRAITDENYIHQFLSIFNLHPYEEDKTGTIVIIPFIDENKILNNSLIDGVEKSWWQDEIEEYLKVSILRWYFPRLSSKYKYGPRLIAIVNDVSVAPNNDTPIFGKLIDLYNLAVSGGESNWIKQENVIRKTYVKESSLGNFVYGKVSKDELGMIKKHLPSPYTYAQIDVDEEGQQNDPLICFCRKPGMIVNYEHSGTCTAGIKSDKNEYIIGLFVLNSSNYITFPETINLDEYIRQSEKSDHTTWSDHPIGKHAGKIQIVSHINRNIGNILSKSYGEEKVVSGDASISMNLATKFGKLLMPDHGFGNSGSAKKIPNKGKRGGGGVIIVKDKNVIDFISQTFVDGSLCLDYDFRILSKISSITLINKIDTIQGLIHPNEWENRGLLYPCDIEKIALKSEKYSDEKVMVLESNNEDNYYHHNKINFLFTDSGKCYGIKLCFEKFVRDNFKFRLLLNTNDKLIRTNIEIHMEE